MSLKSFATALAGGALILSLSLPSGADGISVGAGASVGDSGGVSAGLGASIGGSGGINAGAGASIGGSNGVNAGAVHRLAAASGLSLVQGLRWAAVVESPLVWVPVSVEPAVSLPALAQMWAVPAALPRMWKSMWCEQVASAWRPVSALEAQAFLVHRALLERRGPLQQPGRRALPACRARSRGCPAAN